LAEGSEEKARLRFILPQRVRSLPRGRDVIIDAAWTKGQAISPFMSSAAAKKARPKYLSLSALLFEIRLPLPGWISILHRISGLLLFFPVAAWLLYLLDSSLVSQQGFDRVRDQYLQLPVVKLALVVFVWAYCHHFCAGIRFLFLDLDKGLDLRVARLTSALVLVTSLLLTAFFAVKIW
jgi:succinate dehydrogenase / fumarate reductase cytochrome b subunit